MGIYKTPFEIYYDKQKKSKPKPQAANLANCANEFWEASPDWVEKYKKMDWAKHWQELKEHLKKSNRNTPLKKI